MLDVEVTCNGWGGSDTISATTCLDHKLCSLWKVIEQMGMTCCGRRYGNEPFTRRCCKWITSFDLKGRLGLSEGYRLQTALETRTSLSFISFGH